MNNWKIIPSIVLATVLIFSAGVFTGGLLVNYVKHGVIKKTPSLTTNAAAHATNFSITLPTNAPAKYSPPLPEILSKPFLTKLDEQLRLTSEQHKAVEKIINEGQDDIKKTVRSARLEIREVLTPEQLKQFDLLMKRPSNKNNSGSNGSSNGTGGKSSFQENQQLPKLSRYDLGQPTVSNLSPEAQILVIEKQRVEAHAAEVNALPPRRPFVPTNSSSGQVR